MRGVIRHKDNEDIYRIVPVILMKGAPSSKDASSMSFKKIMTLAIVKDSPPSNYDTRTYSITVL